MHERAQYEGVVHGRISIHLLLHALGGGSRASLAHAHRNFHLGHTLRRYRLSVMVLLSADGVGTNAIMRQTGKSKTCVWRWQERFMQEGSTAFCATRRAPSRILPLGQEVAERVMTLTQSELPLETSHWTADLMAQASGISASGSRRIWEAHGLQPHRCRQFKLSNDPKFVNKLREVVGLYVDPPAQPSCCRSMKRAKSRLSTAPTRGCR